MSETRTAFFYLTGFALENSPVQLTRGIIRKIEQKDFEELTPIKKIYGICADDCNTIFEVTLLQEGEEISFANNMEFVLESFFSPHNLLDKNEPQVYHGPPFVKFIRTEFEPGTSTFQPISLSSFILKITNSTSNNILKNENIEKFKKHMNLVIENKKDSLNIAVSRYNRILKIRNWLDELLDYVIGFESILGQTKEDGSISYKLSMRASCLLSDDPVQRNKIYKFIKEMYKIRSCIAHGSEASEKLKKYAKTIHVHESIVILYLRQMLRELILVSLNLGERDVNQVIDENFRACPPVK